MHQVSDHRSLMYHHSNDQRQMAGQMLDHHHVEPSSVQMSDNSVILSNQAKVSSHFNPTYPMSVSNNSGIPNHELSASYS